MSQHDYSVANASGATVRADINSALDAIASLNSGATAPAVTFANMWWMDTANNLLKQRDNANTAWVTIASKSGTTWIPYVEGTVMSTVGKAVAVAANAGAARTAIGTVIGTDVLAPNGDGSSLTGIHTQGKQTVYIPAAALRPRSANGCAALAVTNGASNQPDIPYLAFDGAAKEYAGFNIQMPKSWNRGTVTAMFIGQRASGTGAANVVLGIRAVAVSDSDTPAANFGSDATVTDACDTTTTDLQMTAETSACTVAGTPAAGDMVFFEVFRDGAAGGDTLNSVDWWLIGVVLFYTTNAANDV